MTMAGRLIGLLLTAGILGCTPRVAVEAPEKPITINLNIKLDADVRVKLDEAAKKDIETHPNVF
jgi:hypothetical protein